jgi:hypothetical protein
MDVKTWLLFILGLVGAAGQGWFSFLLPSHLEYTFILFPSFLSNFRNSIDTGALVCFLGPLVGKVFNSLGTQASPDAIKASKPPPPALFSPFNSVL